MRRYVQVFLMAIAFDLYWTLVVLFRERGLFIWLALAILCWLRLPPEYRASALLLAAAGCGLDTIWALSGLVDFNGDTLLPLWMAALWLMFAVVWIRLICAATLPGWLLALAAAFGGPTAYLLGAYLGAMTLLAPTAAVFGTMACGWLAMMLVFHMVMGRRQ